MERVGSFVITGVLLLHFANLAISSLVPYYVNQKNCNSNQSISINGMSSMRIVVDGCHLDCVIHFYDPRADSIINLWWSPFSLPPMDPVTGQCREGWIQLLNGNTGAVLSQKLCGNIGPLPLKYHLTHLIIKVHLNTTSIKATSCNATLHYMRVGRQGPIAQPNKSGPGPGTLAGILAGVLLPLVLLLPAGFLIYGLLKGPATITTVIARPVAQPPPIMSRPRLFIPRPRTFIPRPPQYIPRLRPVIRTQVVPVRRYSWRWLLFWRKNQEPEVGWQERRVPRMRIRELGTDSQTMALGSEPSESGMTRRPRSRPQRPELPDDLEVQSTSMTFNPELSLRSGPSGYPDDDRSRAMDFDSEGDFDSDTSI